jgi:hypothetical protein
VKVPQAPFDAEGSVLRHSLAAVETLAAWPVDPGLPRPEAVVALALDGLRNEFAGWTPVQAVSTDTRRFPTVDGLAAASLWNCYEGPPVWADAETGEASGSIELPAADRLGFLRADTVGTFAVSAAPSVQEALRAAPAACGKDTPTTFAWAKQGAATADHPARVDALFTVTCGTVDAREGRERVAVSQLLVYDASGNLSLLAGGQAATLFGWRGEGAGSVLSDALRVGAYTDAVRLTEGPPPSTP